MKFRYIYQLFFIIITIGFSSCGKDSSCFKGTGNIIQEQRTISSDVTMIRTSDNIDIVITQGNEASLIIEGGENLLPYINTDISGSEITISSDNKCSMFRDYSVPITVYLSIPNLTHINYTGQGIITSTNTLNLSTLVLDCWGGTGSLNLILDAENVSLNQHSGYADFTLSGTANSSYVYTLGNGWFYLKDFVVNNTHINHIGTGDMIINVTVGLKVELKSIGNLLYYGNPNIDISDHSGSGKILQQ